MLLEAAGDIDIVGESTDGQAAVDEAIRLRPDVVLMDLTLPVLNGVEATSRIVREAEPTKVLVLSMHSGDDHLRAAMRAGASGYLVKGAGVSDLITGIRAVARGEAVLSQRAAATLASSRDEGLLTAREREVLQLVTEGCSTAEVARKLGLSAKTVEAHRSRIMTKLGATNAASLVRSALRLGLIAD